MYIRRLKMQNTLCNFFRSVMALTPDDMADAVHLCMNQVGYPVYISIG
jgi:DNA ligase-1